MGIIDILKRPGDRRRVKAVYEGDMEELLDSLGILEDIKGGQEHCEFCEKNIEIEDISAIVPIEDRIGVVCDNPSCLKELKEWR